ncbi:class I SAM-dependent methyltransferase [Megalodesulfovibrio paquesii]
MYLQHLWQRLLGKLRSSQAITPAHGHDYAAIAAQEAVRLQDVRGRTVLVAGCGDGRECGLFLQAGAAVVHGVDPSARLGRAFRHPRVRYHQIGIEASEATDLPPCDLVFSHATLEHVADLEGAFAGLYRAVRPGGLLHVTSGPLWHSRYGHHKANLFQSFPWIHLCLSQDEILDWFLRHTQDSMPQDLEAMDAHIAEMFDPTRLNMRPAREYLRLAATLPARALVNALVLDDASLLTPAIRAQLARPYDALELLAVNHRFIARR